MNPTKIDFQIQEWTIDVEDGETVVLTFQAFDLEEHPDCVWDWVEVSYGSISQKFCGSTVPEPINSTSYIKVKIHSDSSVTGAGFSASWAPVNPARGFQSQNHPGNYPNNYDEVSSMLCLS